MRIVIMQLLLLRTPSGLLPHDEDGVKAVQKIAVGDTILVDYKPRRNIKFHRKLFALLNAVLPNQQQHKTVDNLLNEVKLRAGHFDIHVTSRGEQVYVPKSIAFHSMDEVAFEMFYSKALDVAVELTDEQAVEEILKFL
jgi:hypothetical protein